MIIYDGTFKRIANRPRAGFLNNATMWPLDKWPGGRTTLPLVQHIREAAEPNAAFYWIDDSHALSKTQLAELVREVKLLTGKHVGIYNQPWSIAVARNLLQENLLAIADRAMDDAIHFNTPVDVILPSLYFEYPSQYTDVDEWVAWQLVSLHTLAMAFRAAHGKPVIPFLWLDTAFAKYGRQILDWCERMHLKGVVIWGESAINAEAFK